MYGMGWFFRISVRKFSTAYCMDYRNLSLKSMLLPFEVKTAATLSPNYCPLEIKLLPLVENYFEKKNIKLNQLTLCTWEYLSTKWYIFLKTNNKLFFEYLSLLHDFLQVIWNADPNNALDHPQETYNIGKKGINIINAP